MSEPVEAGEAVDPGRRQLPRSVAAWAAGLYLLVQVCVPLVVLVRSDVSSRDFSWDMFSYELSCEQLEVIVRTPGQPWQSLRLDRDFSSWAQLRRLLSAARFGAYARGICASLQQARGALVQLRVLSRCRTDRDAQPVAILDPERDFCAAPRSAR